MLHRLAGRVTRARRARRVSCVAYDDYVRDADGKFAPSGGGGGGGAGAEEPKQEKPEAPHERAAREAEEARAAVSRATSVEERKALNKRKDLLVAKAKREQEKLWSSVESLRAINAPITKSGKIDAAKVPGATKDFRPLVSVDPADSYRGRSYRARNEKEMSDELLGAAAGQWTNEQVLLKQLGNLSVKDPTQWESISEKYETPVSTYAEAVRVLARQSTGGGEWNWLKRPDWRNFDFDALRACPGLEKLQPPAWLMEAKSAEEEREHMARSFHDAGAGEAGGDEDDVYAPPDEHGHHEEVPFERRLP